MEKDLDTLLDALFELGTKFGTFTEVEYFDENPSREIEAAKNDILVAKEKLMAEIRKLM